MNVGLEFTDLPQISVVIPVHNGAPWLAETLEALYAQIFRNFEIVLIDDASTDAIREVLSSHTDPRLRVVHLQTNVGVSAARNHGIERARGRYIAFCDADDLCQPQRLGLQLGFLERNSEIGLCGSAFTCFDTQDRETVSHPESHMNIRKALMVGNCFGLSTVMVRASILKEHHGFDTSIDLAEDYELWTRLLASGVGAANLPESLVRYRLHPHQASRQHGVRLNQISSKVRALYCAGLIGNSAWVQRLNIGRFELADLIRAGSKVEGYVASHPEFSTQDFRFLLAWLYQHLPSHGLLPWLRWCRLQRVLYLQLDLNYRLNIALLALLPAGLRKKYFDRLIKLKR